MSPITPLALALSSVAAGWQPSEFPLGYWYGPPVSHNTRETWQRVKDCGFTFGGMQGYPVEENRKMLDLCAEVGLKAMVIDPRIAVTMTAGDRWRETLAQVVADYGSHPALYGYFITDEPNYREFEALGLICREFEQLDPDHLAYINLFPTYASVAQLGTPDYRDHLAKFLQLTGSRVLSYDHYALLKNGGLRADYFENLALVREAALQAGVPPWYILLSLPHLGYRDPTDAEMRWQVYTALAYGMKGLMYFTYWTAPAWEQNGEIAIVNSDGSPARLYPIVQTLNHEVQALGSTLLGLTSTGVFHTGPIPPGATRLGTDAIVQLADDLPAVLGFFRDAQGREYAMIVNNDYANAADLTLRLRGHVTRILALRPTDGAEEELPLTERTAALRLEPGAGRLLRLETEFAYPAPAKPLAAIAFRFDTPGDLEGWEGFHSLAGPVVADGTLTLTFTGPDPFLSRGMLRIEPDRYRALRVRMKLPPCNPEGQVFWATAEEPQFADNKYLNFPVQPDGQWHEYLIPVGEHPRWRGQTIIALRLDPTTGGAAEGTQVVIDGVVGE